MADDSSALIAELRRQLADAQSATKAAEKQVAELTPKAALADTLSSQIGDLKKAQSDLAKQHEAALAKVQADHAADMTFTGRGVTDPTWRNYFAQQHAAQAEGGEKDLSKWLDGLVAAPDKVTDPILRTGLDALKLRPADTPAGGAPGQGRPPGSPGGLPNLPGQGVTGRPPPAGAGQFNTPEALAGAFKDPAAVQANWAALQQAHPQFAGLPNPLGSTPPGGTPSTP